jgi:hypothetical protein
VGIAFLSLMLLVGAAGGSAEVMLDGGARGR